MALLSASNTMLYALYTALHCTCTVLDWQSGTSQHGHYHVDLPQTSVDVAVQSVRLVHAVRGRGTGHLTLQQHLYKCYTGTEMKEFNCIAIVQLYNGNAVELFHLRACVVMSTLHKYCLSCQTDIVCILISCAA